MPAAVVIDAGRSRAVGVRLELPDDAAPGVYAVVLGVRPGGSEGARLTFRIEPAESTRPWLRQAENLAMWLAPALVGAVVVVLVVRRQQTGSKPLRVAPLDHAGSREPLAEPSGLRDHEHDGHDGKRDAADGEQPDGAELQRYVAAGSQRLLQLALALCADDQQPDRE